MTTRRKIVYFLAIPVIVIAVAVYLVLTGENGLSRPKPSARAIDVTRPAPTEIRELGWNPDGVAEVFGHVATLSTDAFMIVTAGKIVGAYGDLSKPYSVHSIRKSLLSALIGQRMASAANSLPLDATLSDLGIDDAPAQLTALQRQTTVRHLLRSVSGINHPAAASGGLQAEIDNRLGHEENPPGTLWAYNNWDYNALTTIFEKETGTGIGEAFGVEIANPIGLQDFERSAVSYLSDTGRSQHRAAMFEMSARDLARIGNLYLNDGMAHGQRILAEGWASLMTKEFTETGLGGMRWGHGYLWWVPAPETGLPEGTFWAWGLGNQALIIIPAWETVVVHQSDTTEFLKRFLPLIGEGGMTGEAAIEQLIRFCRGAEALKTDYCAEHRFITRREFDQMISLIVAARV